MSSWLNFTGRTAADFPMDIHGGGSIPAYLLHPHNAIADAFSTLAPALKDYLEKKKNDEIANQLMNMESAKRAEPVMNNGQYVSGGPGMDASGVADFNTSLGFPGTSKTPDRGGTAGYKMQKLYQDYLNNQPDTATDDLNYQILWNKAHPDEAPDETGMTPYQREQTRLREMEIQRKTQHQNQSPIPMYSRAIARGRLSNKGEFDNNYAEAATGDMAQVRTPDGKTLLVPWSAYQQSQQFSGAKAFQDRQSQMTEPDLPPIGPSTVPNVPNESIQSPSSAAGNDPYVVGKKYRDKDGNVATYLGNGQWR